NVVIDFLCERGEFYLPAARIVVKAYQGEIELCCSAMTFATASYLMERGKVSTAEIFRKLADFCSLCDPTPIDASVVSEALNSSFVDFEDAMQYFSAKGFGANIIVTRNKQDFAPSELTCLTPVEFLG
ncbi:MAG: PIN domain-containing protein, partial [Bacteroidaceae bacterium]|nr:PIN domain-containing protein [Bacteroidaceae bacterium]